MAGGDEGDAGDASPRARLPAMVLIAHAGHWLPQLLYLAPVAVMLVALGLGRRRARREASEHTDASGEIRGS